MCEDVYSRSWKIEVARQAEQEKFVERVIREIMIMGVDATREKSVRRIYGISCALHLGVDEELAKL